MTALSDKVKELPLLPGCYIFKNKDGTIIYVGKSKCLRKRVRQYFQSPDKKEGKIEKLVKEIADFDYIITDTETDALLLECKMIKEYRPYYNAQLKRSRKYPVLNITLNKDYPGIYVCGSTDRENVISFGCFRYMEDAENTLELINSIWKTPLCNREFFDGENKNRACLNKHIGKCCAPCIKEITKEAYQRKIKEVTRFLQNKDKKILKALNKEMRCFSADMEFEKALSVRDRIFRLEQLQKTTRKFNTNLKGKDYCVFLRAYHEKSFSIFYIKDGKACSRIILSSTGCVEEEKVKEFAENIMEGKCNLPEDNQLAGCITAVYADKLYVEITDIMKRRNIKTLVKRITFNILFMKENREQEK